MATLLSRRPSSDGLSTLFPLWWFASVVALYSSEGAKLPGERKRPMGLSIYCLGAFNNMRGHLDGLAPDWALTVSDWEAFNRETE